MAETLPALSTTRLKMRSGPAGTIRSIEKPRRFVGSGGSADRGRVLSWHGREVPYCKMESLAKRFPGPQGGVPQPGVVSAAQLSRVIARHTGERRVDVYERLITRWTEPLARQTVTLRNLLMVILPASTGELVKLELGEIDFEWLADFATRALREIYGDL